MSASSRPPPAPSPQRPSRRLATRRLRPARDFGDKQSSIMLECFTRLRTLGRKMGGSGGGSTSRELCKALSDSWATVVLAIGILGSATFCPFSKKWREDESSAIMELSGMALAAQAVVNLVSGWNRGSDDRVMMGRIAVK